MQFKNFKSLASTHIKKSILLLVISSMSALMLCSCGNNEDSASIETDVTEATTQTPTEATTEQTELENQDKDPTEATTQGTTQQTTQTPSTTGTTQTPGNTNQNTQTPTTENPAHVHTWTTETYYTTETQVVHHDAVTHIVHHDAVTHQEQVTTYTTETQSVERFMCCDCGATFDSASAADAHCMSCEHYSGFTNYYETVETQVPHTETQTVVDQAAWDETVVDTPAWDETVEVQVPHTRTVCSECGATK